MALKTLPLLALVSSLALAASPSLAAAGKTPLPDWRGVWDNAEGNLFDPSAGRSSDVNERDPGKPPREYPPYKPEWEAKYQVELDSVARGEAHDPGASCIPPGMPRLISSPYAWEFVLTDEKVYFLKELQHDILRIYTDGRAHPPTEDLDPTFNGHSIGHWEGDTLVVETVGLRDDTWFDRTGAPHSKQLRIVMRLRKTSPDVIENNMTLEDPIAFTKSWKVTRHFKRAKDYDIREFVCEENNRNPLDASGKTSLISQ